MTRNTSTDTRTVTRVADLFDALDAYEYTPELDACTCCGGEHDLTDCIQWTDRLRTFLGPDA